MKVPKSERGAQVDKQKVHPRDFQEVLNHATQTGSVS